MAPVKRSAASKAAPVEAADIDVTLTTVMQSPGIRTLFTAGNALRDGRTFADIVLADGHIA